MRVGGLPNLSFFFFFVKLKCYTKKVLQVTATSAKLSRSEATNDLSIRN